MRSILIRLSKMLCMEHDDFQQVRKSFSQKERREVFGKLSNLVMEKTREGKMDRQNKEWWGIEKDRKGEKPMCMINKRKTSWMGYMLYRICLLQKIMEEKVEGNEGRGRRRFGILTTWRKEEVTNKWRCLGPCEMQNI